MKTDVVVIPAQEVRELSGKREKRLRVAAYCRVSTDEERQLGSFENQIEYFSNLITGQRDYDLVHIYSDEGISGCSTKSRAGFRAMIADCEAGKIDLVITKSISRFARNTQDSLNYTRKLKEKGIGVYFEKEGINTLESSGELLLTLFSCFAQEESRSISENTAWGIRSKFQQGIPHLNVENLLGYDKDEKGKLVIREEQASIVRRIFRMYLEGLSLNAIAGSLNRDEIKGVRGDVKWCATTIGRVLENEKYKGSLLMQKTFTTNYLTKRNAKNTGQLTQYYVEQNHPAIIPPEEWEAVQQEIRRRRASRQKYGIRGLGAGGGSPFLSRLFCAECERAMRWLFQKGMKRAVWICPECGRRIEHEKLRALFCDAFNSIVTRREEYLPRWEELIRSGSALEKVRARQMMEITAEGTILFEVPELTQAVLKEAWMVKDDRVRFVFCSGDVHDFCDQTEL